MISVSESSETGREEINHQLNQALFLLVIALSALGMFLFYQQGKGLEKHASVTESPKIQSGIEFEG